MITISLIASGKLSYNLSRVFSNNENFQIIEIYSRQKKNNNLFDEKIKFTDKIENLKKADFYFILCNDDSIKEISKKVNVNSGMVLHSSGTININILSNHKNYGVFYPLQTFNFHNKLNFTDVPVLIEANTKKNLDKLKRLCELLNTTCKVIDSKDRLYYHLAATFANNFTNHLLSVTDKIINKFNLNKDFFIPISNQTIQKFKENKSKESQTGPAIRNDVKTIKKHERILENSNYLNLYKIITESIKKNDL